MTSEKPTEITARTIPASDQCHVAGSVCANNHKCCLADLAPAIQRYPTTKLNVIFATGGNYATTQMQARVTNNGQRPYTCMVPAELDRAIQKRALELASRSLLRDEHGTPVEIRVGPSGRHVARYAIARIALNQFANGANDTTFEGSSQTKDGAPK